MKRAMWLTLSGLLVLALLLASCGEAAPEKKEGTTVTGEVIQKETPTAPTTPTTPTTLTTPRTPAVAEGEPQYGGTLVVMQSADPNGFDPYRYTWSGSRMLTGNCLEGLGMGDLGRGPSGTGEYMFNTWYIPVEYSKGALAESWEASPDGLTYTFHIRKGVYFHNKPPANGRELVAADVKYCFDRRCGTGSGFTKPTPWNATTGMETITEITTPDKYTVVFQCSQYSFAQLFQLLNDYSSEIYPPEVIQTYGNMDDWHYVCGTGAVMLTDYVPASSLTFTKNPSYWGYDENHPENRLPYIDSLVMLIVPDTSTQQAAMRAGRADVIAYPYVRQVEAEQMMQTNPELQYWWMDGGFCSAVFLRLDKEPFTDVRVRQALQMSIDLLGMNKISRASDPNDYPSQLPKGYGSEFYTPFDELPEDVQTIYTYNPEKAKQLLREAGYPNGFTMTVSSGPSTSSASEFLPVVADYFEKIGVKMNIQALDSSVLSKLWSSKTYEQAIGQNGLGVTVTTCFPYVCGTESERRVIHSDQYVLDQWEKITGIIDPTERARLMKELNYYLMRNAFYIAYVVFSPTYAVAQPWVGGGHGELMNRRHGPGNVLIHFWIDQAMKKAKTGK